MTSFSRFQEIVRAMGGQWAGPHVVFTRTQSEYHAACNGEWVHLLAPGGYWSAKGVDAERRLTW